MRQEAARLRVAVIGAGSWGTTIATLAADRHDTVLWARRREVAEEVAVAGTNAGYTDGVRLPGRLRATASLEEAVAGADVVVMAVPSYGFRAVLVEAAPHLPPEVPVVSLTKGLEPGTLLRMTEVVDAVLSGHPAGVLTGPNLSAEILAGQPAAAVMAFADERLAVELRPVFHTETFRVYTNHDVVGCEIAGAAKNVIAIAAGMVEGMGFGDNTKAAVVTRGLAEMSRLGAALRADPATFVGLAGMGDLMATCASDCSRNHRIGVELGRGRSLDDAVAGMHMVAEGIGASRSICDLALVNGVDMPIAAQVRAVCHGGRPAADAMASLLRRAPRAEA